MANALPKDLNLPKFSNEKKEEKKAVTPKTTKEEKTVETPKQEKPTKVEEKVEKTETVETVETVEEKKVETKVEESVPEKSEAEPAENKKGKKVKAKDIDPLNSNVFIPNQPMLGTWRLLFPYLLRFLYFTLLLVCCVAVFVLPTIKLASDITVTFPGAEEKIPFADAVTQLKDSNALFNTIYGITHGIVSGDGLYSIFDVVFVHMADILVGNVSAMGIIGVAGELWCVTLFAIILVVEIIWFTIKFISSLIGLIFFWARKHKKIDNFYYKNTKGFYTLGLLNWDFTFVVAIILNGLIFAGMNFKIPGFTLFDSIFNTNLMNQGNITLMILFGSLLVVRILYRLSVILLSKKVKKMYVRKMNYKALKKAAKTGVEIH